MKTWLTLSSSAATLTYTESVGVAPEVNLRTTQVRKHAKGIHPDFETRGRHYQKSKTGISVVPRKGLMSSKFIWKTLELFRASKTHLIGGSRILRVGRHFGTGGGGGTHHLETFSKKKTCMKLTKVWLVRGTTILTSTPPTPPLAAHCYPLRSTNGLFRRTKSPENAYLPETMMY